MPPTKMTSSAAATAGRNRRGAVAAGNMDDSQGKYVHKVHKKTPEDEALIRKGLEKSPIFANFEAKLLSDIMAALEPHKVPAGTEVIRQGDQGDYFYVIKSGKYEVSKLVVNEVKAGAEPKRGLTRQMTAKVTDGQVPTGAERVIVAMLGDAACFGELALMYSSPRAATVTAISAGEVWRVDREVFRGILYRSASATRLRFLRQVPVLSGVSEHHMTTIHGSLSEMDVKAGQSVAPDNFYIVCEGKIKLAHASDSDKTLSRPVLAGAKDGSTGAALEKFSFFGDREILTGEGGFTYTADKDGCKLMCMSKDKFLGYQEMLGSRLKDLLAFNVLRSIPLLKDVKSDQLLSVLDRFQAVSKKAGETIVQQGVIGQNFFISCKGTMEVIIDQKKIASLAPHTFVGERSLLSDDVTAADVIASTPCELLALSRSDFNVMLGPLKEIIAKEFKKSVIRKVKILDLLSDSEVEALAAACTLVRYNKGETILKQGEVGETFYMMKSGQVTVAKDGQEIAKLAQGAFFGERALIEDEPRGATITAVGVVECFVIDRDDFTKHLGSMQDLMKTQDQKSESKKSECQIKLNELKTIGMLGSGAFGLVSLVKDEKHTGKTFALKAINKAYVKQLKMQVSLQREVQVLKMVDHPMLMSLVKTFKDSKRVYMLLNPLMGGELFVHLGNAEVFDEKQSIFYAACVLLGLNHLHSKGVIYRDLKLENLLLDSKGYLKIVDFGFAKQLQQDELAYTLCGTPDYLAPEIIKGTGHDKGCDLWSLGILIYEMLHGYTPFGADDDAQIFTGILSGGLEFEDHISDNAQSIIRALLNRNPKTRLGNGKFGVKPIMSHPWFKSVNWTALEKEKVPAPFIPTIKSEGDTSNFDDVDIEMHEEQCVECADSILDPLFESSF